MKKFAMDRHEIERSSACSKFDTHVHLHNAWTGDLIGRSDAKIGLPYVLAEFAASPGVSVEDVEEIGAKPDFQPLFVDGKVLCDAHVLVKQCTLAGMRVGVGRVAYFEIAF